MIKILFGTITLSATLRLATPIIIAAVGGSFLCYLVHFLELTEVT